jgi:hypothetical protein
VTGSRLLADVYGLPALCQVIIIKFQHHFGTLEVYPGFRSSPPALLYYVVLVNQSSSPSISSFLSAFVD